MQEIRFLPRRWFTDWIYTAAFYPCRTRITEFQLTLDDVHLVEQEYIEITNSHLRADIPFLFVEYEFYDEMY